MPMNSQPEDKIVEFSGLQDQYADKLSSLMDKSESAEPAIAGTQNPTPFDSLSEAFEKAVALDHPGCQGNNRTQGKTDVDNTFHSASNRARDKFGPLQNATSEIYDELGNNNPIDPDLFQDSKDSDSESDIAGALLDEDLRQKNLSDLEEIGRLIKRKNVKNIIVLAGAGISTSAGIPDFRSSDTGLYANLEKFNLPVPEAIFDLAYFKHNPEAFFVLCKDLYPGKHMPTPVHRFFKLLEDRQQLRRVYTQNIDTLERRAGLSPDLLVEAHGLFASSHCLTCRSEVDESRMRQLIGSEKGAVIYCEHCGGLVKPDIIFFGEDLPARYFELANVVSIQCPGNRLYDLVLNQREQDLPQCDLLIVIGTSLQVQPFASLIDKVPIDCPRLLINRNLVGQSEATFRRPFQYKQPTRDRFYLGEADHGVKTLASQIDATVF